MSQENVARFFEKAGANPELGSKLAAAAPTASAWVAVAREAGLPFTVEELRAFAGAVLDKVVEGEDFVAQLLSPPAGELKEADLAGVAGGVGTHFEANVSAAIARLGRFSWGGYMREGGTPTIGPTGNIGGGKV